MLCKKSFTFYLTDLQKQIPSLILREHQHLRFSLKMKLLWATCLDFCFFGTYIYSINNFLPWVLTSGVFKITLESSPVQRENQFFFNLTVGSLAWRPTGKCPLARWGTIVLLKRSDLSSGNSSSWIYTCGYIVLVVRFSTETRV